jgi:hypothetical protein
MISVKNIHIKHLIMMAVNGYNNCELRSFNLVNTGVEQQILNRIVNENGKIDPAVISRNVSSIVVPNTESEGVAPIINGWQEKRYIFILQVDVEFSMGNGRVYFFQGYTDYKGVNESSLSIDPELIFTINSFVSITHSKFRDNIRGVYTRDILTGSGNVLADTSRNTVLEEGNNLVTLRPVDVYSGIEAYSFVNELEEYNGYGKSIDSRVTLTRVAVPSDVSNNMPHSWLGKVLNGYKTARTLMDTSLDTGKDSIISISKREVQEPYLEENPLFLLISRTKNQNFISSDIKYRDLQKIQPDIYDRIHLIKTNNTARSIKYSPRSTSSWERTDRNTIVATTLTHSITALMMEHLLQSVSFVAVTNYNLGRAEIDLRFSSMRSMVDAYSNSSDSIDVDIIASFKHRIINEVLYDLTFGFQEYFALLMEADIFSDTLISLAIGDNEQIDYVVPTFANSKFSPVLTTNQDNLYRISSEIDNMLSNVFSTDNQYSRCDMDSNSIHLF